MSPEQVQFVRNDPRSDLFALGVMLYHLTTGERPFGAPTSVRGLRRRLYRDPMPPRALRADCPPWLQEVILHCLEVQPERRYQSGGTAGASTCRIPTQVDARPSAPAQPPAAAARLKVIKRWFFALGADSEPVDARRRRHSWRRARSSIAAIDVDERRAGAARAAARDRARASSSDRARRAAGLRQRDDDARDGARVTIATPMHATTMPAHISGVGSTPKTSHSQSAATGGVR